MTMLAFVRLAILVAVAGTSAAFSAQPGSAIVKQVHSAVTLLTPGGPPQRVTVGTTLRLEATVQTGPVARVELAFDNQALARVGAGSSLRFGGSGRDLDLERGTTLLQAPASLTGVRIRAGGISCIASNTTFLVEYLPAGEVIEKGQKKSQKGYVKAIVLQGNLRVTVNHRIGESVLLEPGQMIIVDPASRDLPASVDIDLRRILETSVLIDDQKFGGGKTPAPAGPALPGLERAIAAQKSEKGRGTLIETNLSIFGRGTSVMIKPPDPASLPPTSRAPAPAPSPGS